MQLNTSESNKQIYCLKYKKSILYKSIKDILHLINRFIASSIKGEG